MRADWFSEENLERYFEAVRDVLLNVGVAVINPDYDPDSRYSQELFINVPERICS